MYYDVTELLVFLPDEDECVSQSPCEHSCQNLIGGFSCACPSGFTISPVSHTCQGEMQSIRLQHATPRFRCRAAPGRTGR